MQTELTKLIDKYEARIKRKEDYLRFQLTQLQRNCILNDIDNIRIFLKDLKAALPQEQMNIEEAYIAAKVNCADMIANNRVAVTAEQYFIQTFNTPSA